MEDEQKDAGAWGGADWTGHSARVRRSPRVIAVQIVVLISVLVLAWPWCRSLSGLGSVPEHRGWMAWLQLMDEVGICKIIDQ